MTPIHQWTCSGCGFVQSSAAKLKKCFACKTVVGDAEVVGFAAVKDIDPTTMPRTTFSADTVSGPELWDRLHKYRWVNLAEFREWFKTWLVDVDRLPGCRCSKDFRSVVLPKFAERIVAVQSDSEWFDLTWEIHDVVNRKLGKCGIAIEEARKLHRGEL